MSKLKQFFWPFSLGLGLMIGLSVLGKINDATLALPPVSPQAIANVSLPLEKPISLLAQNPSPSIPVNSSSPNNPLISKGPEHLIYIGLFLLLVTLVNVAGLLSKKVKSALIFSSILSVILIGLLWFF